jgi:sulfide:quinone oxidoreductase
VTARERIVVVGGGVAAVEAILALRALVGRQAEIVQIAPEPEFSPPAPSVATPFGFGMPTPVRLDRLAADYGVQLHRTRLERVEAGDRLAVPKGLEPIAYDHLVVAVGAPRRAAVQGAVTFRGPGDVAAAETVMNDIAEGRARRLVIAVPSADAWPLPAYELAIMAAVDLRSRGVDAPDVALVTPEHHPLEVFGPVATGEIGRLLHQRGIRLGLGRVPRRVAGGALEMDVGDPVAADRVIALPQAAGPYVPGLPHDRRGFIPVDPHGRVEGCADVYAAGDATTFPVRQGGLAAQQADAVAETIAARMGAVAGARPFRPVLRGVLLTGGAPLYLRTELGTHDPPVARHLHAVPVTDASARALWWPPSKVAGRYLAPLLATARPVPLVASPMRDIGYTAPEERHDDDALQLALALADEDAACGDYRQALHALDTARALGGGVLPNAYEAKQRDWQERA